MSDVAATRIEDLKIRAKLLQQCESNIEWIIEYEMDASRQMALELARLEIHRLMEMYSREALRLSLTASVESGE